MRKALAVTAACLLALPVAASPPEAHAATTPGLVGPIVFSSARDGNPEIFRMNPDGTGLTQLTFTSNIQNLGPTISPDGTKIAFERGYDNALFSTITVMNIDGSAPVDLPYTGNWNANPAFSPDGERIAFDAYDPYGETLLASVWTMNVDGTDRQKLTGDNFDAHPSYTPDGSKIVFTSFRDGNNEIYSMNVDGTSQTRLTFAGGADDGPRVSPDGTKVAFSSHRDGNAEIYTMDLDGTDQTRLTSAAGADQAPSYSPDGARITFASTRDGNSEIYVMDDGGANQVRRTSHAAHDGTPDWGVLKTTCQGKVVTITGTAGNDVLTGTEGDDVIAGHGGDDVINGLDGADTICGGDGTDTVTYKDHELAVGANLGGGVGDDGSAEDGPLGARDTIARDVENLTGGYGSDALAGSSRDNLMTGGPGDDSLSGGVGNDKLYGSTGEDRLVGGDGNDQLYGLTSDDALLGGEGTDTLVGGADADDLIGGPGRDTATYTDHPGGVVVTIGAGVDNDGNATDGPAAARDHVAGTTENLIGSAANDSLTGNDLDNRLTGGLGADVLLGLAGSDTLVATDGVVDTTIDCGADTDDPAQSDPGDPAPISCP
jgi:TolB protein